MSSPARGVVLSPVAPQPPRRNTCCLVPALSTTREPSRPFFSSANPTATSRQEPKPGCTAPLPSSRQEFQRQQTGISSSEATSSCQRISSSPRHSVSQVPDSWEGGLGFITFEDTTVFTSTDLPTPSPPEGPTVSPAGVSPS